MTIANPLLLYLGSKWRLAPKIMALFAPHDIYVEPYGGSFSIGLRKPRSRVEVWNDVDGELVNLFRILRSPDAARLVEQVSLTPYAREEYLACFEPSPDPVERARRLIVRLQMGHGSSSSRTDRQAGFRVDGPKGRTTVAAGWARYPETLVAVVDRLRGVCIESRPAVELIRAWSDPAALVYLDPTYMPETRSKKCKRGEGYTAYAVEMSPADHEEMLEAARASTGQVIISGYHSALYDGALGGWEKREFAARSHDNRARTEVVWINPVAWDAYRAAQPMWERVNG